MPTRVSLLAVVVSGVLLACGGDGSTSSSSSSSSGGSSSGGSSSGDTTFDSGAPTTTTPTPKTISAPKIDEIMKMAGGLHVVWTNPADATCDKVTLERKTETESYKVVYSLPGSADNKHDATATANKTYTYRVQCFVGTDTSPYSSEMSANPVN